MLPVNGRVGHIKIMMNILPVSGAVVCKWSAQMFWTHFKDVQLEYKVCFEFSITKPGEYTLAVFWSWCRLCSCTSSWLWVITINLERSCLSWSQWYAISLITQFRKVIWGSVGCNILSAHEAILFGQQWLCAVYLFVTFISTSSPDSM